MLTDVKNLLLQIIICKIVKIIFKKSAFTLTKTKL